MVTATKALAHIFPSLTLASDWPWCYHMCPRVWHAPCFQGSVSLVHFFLRNSHFCVCVSYHTRLNQIPIPLKHTGTSLYNSLMWMAHSLADLWNPPLLNLFCWHLLISPGLHFGQAPIMRAWANVTDTLHQANWHKCRILPSTALAFMQSFRQSQALCVNSPGGTQTPVSVLQGHMSLTILISWLMVASRAQPGTVSRVGLCRPSQDSSPPPFSFG